MKTKKPLMLSAILTLILTLTGCVTSTYYPHTNLATNKKSGNEVEYYEQKPTRVAIKTGYISIVNSKSIFWDDVRIEAKRKAGEVGADFIVLENSGTESQTFTTPGQSYFNASGTSKFNGYGSPHSTSLNGHGNYKATGFSQAPSQDTINVLSASYSTWIYTPCHTGIVFEDSKVIGFRLYGDAEEAGVKIGDTLLGFDGYEIDDPELLVHVMNINPEDKIKLVLLRNDKRIECTVTAKKN